MTQQLQHGDVVDIVVKGVRIDCPGGNGALPSYTDEHGRSYPVPGQAAITRVAPADWPPQAGDLWRDGERMLWLAIDVTNPHFHEDQRLALINTFGARRTNLDYALADGPYTLVHRDEQDQPAEQAAEPEAASAPASPEGWPPRLGDVWRYCGRRWFGVGQGPFVALMSTDGQTCLAPADLNLPYIKEALTLLSRGEEEPAGLAADGLIAAEPELAEPRDSVALLRRAAALLLDRHGAVWTELITAPDRDPRYSPPFDPDDEYVRALLLDLEEETARTPVLQLAALLLPSLAFRIAKWLQAVADEAERHAAKHPSNCASEITDGHPIDIAHAVLDKWNGGQP